jgi:Fe-S-cluster containining protein
MKLETSLSKIKRLARVRDDENRDFRAYLKELPFTSRKVDAAVQETVREVSACIDCTKCANCCREMQPVLTPTDIRRLSRETNLPARDFTARYLKPAPAGHPGMIFKSRPCPFLKGNRCSVYEARPRDCKSYPHLHRRDFVQRTMQAILNYAVCPIVFNSYEGLKEKLARRVRPQKS